jgi:hypothetical protein
MEEVTGEMVETEQTLSWIDDEYSLFAFGDSQQWLEQYREDCIVGFPYAFEDRKEISVMHAIVLDIMYFELDYFLRWT